MRPDVTPEVVSVIRGLLGATQALIDLVGKQNDRIDGLHRLVAAFSDAVLEQNGALVVPPAKDVTAKIAREVEELKKLFSLETNPDGNVLH